MRREPRHARIGDIWIDVSIREQHDYAAEVSEHPVERGSAIADHVRPLPRTIEIEGLVTNHPIEHPRSHAGSAQVVRERMPLTAAARESPRVPPLTHQIQAEKSAGGVEFVPVLAQGLSVLGALHIDLRTRRTFAAEVHHVRNRQSAEASMVEYGAEVLRWDQEFDRVAEVHRALVRIVDESQLVTVVTALATYDPVALTRLAFERSAQVGRNALKFSATGRVLRFVQAESATLPSAVTQTKARGKQATTPTPDPDALAPAPPDGPKDSTAYRAVHGIRGS